MRVARRHFVLGGLAAPLAAQRRKAAAPLAQRPNILLILADDLAAWMLGCYGNKEIRTPNIDLLARTGTRFASHFVATPICSASRATLFTGRLPRQHGVQDFLTPNPIEKPPQGQKAPPESFRNEIMISDLLAPQGYECGYVGKWHMGEDVNPQHNFRFWYTMAGGGSSRYQDPSMSWNGKVVEEKGYLTDLMTAKAVEFLDRQSAQKPFFLVASYFNPHTPYDGHPAKYYGMYAQTAFDTIGWERPAANALREKDLLKDTVGNLRKAAAATTALDDQIPLLLRKLQEKSLRDNTLVILAGDNGYLLGRHGLWSKGLASDPINMYEEVMAVPMIWSWPGRVPVQAVRNELVSFYDLLPTISDVLDVPVPAGRNLCGRSYEPLAMGRLLPRSEPWRTTIFGQFRNTEMARDSRYKLVERNEGGGPNELYDLRTDPRERTNQFENQLFLNTKERLTRELAEWRRQYVS